MTHLERKNLERYKIAVDLYMRSVKSKDLKGYDDSVLYGQEKYGMTQTSIYQYKKAVKFIYYDTLTCMLDNKFTISQLIELNGLWLPTALKLYQEGKISHDLTCVELREIAKEYKNKQTKNLNL